MKNNHLVLLLKRRQCFMLNKATTFTLNHRISLWFNHASVYSIEVLISEATYNKFMWIPLRFLAKNVICVSGVKSNSYSKYAHITNIMKFYVYIHLLIGCAWLPSNLLFTNINVFFTNDYYCYHFLGIQLYDLMWWWLKKLSLNKCCENLKPCTIFFVLKWPNLIEFSIRQNTSSVIQKPICLIWG